MEGIFLALSCFITELASFNLTPPLCRPRPSKRPARPHHHQRPAASYHRPSPSYPPPPVYHHSAPAPAAPKPQIQVLPAPDLSHSTPQDSPAVAPAYEAPKEEPAVAPAYQPIYYGQQVLSVLLIMQLKLIVMTWLQLFLEKKLILVPLLGSLDP